MIKNVSRNEQRKIRHARVRNKVAGTEACPRLNVFRSLSHMYAQIIDDTTGTTLVAASTLELKDKLESCGNIEAAKEVGKLIAEKAIEKGIKDVVFDRGGYLYHGRVMELANSAREAGLNF